MCFDLLCDTMHFNRRSVASCLLFWCMWLMYLISTNTQGQTNPIWNVHYEQVSWVKAVNACKDENSDLLCYNNREEMMSVVRAFISNAPPETPWMIWLSSSTSCAEYQEDNMQYKNLCPYLHVNATNNYAAWTVFQTWCWKTLPFICSKKQSVRTTSTTVKTSTYISTTRKETASHEGSSAAITRSSEKTSVFVTTQDENTSLLTTPQENTSILFTTTTTESGISSVSREVTQPSSSETYSTTAESRTSGMPTTMPATLFPTLHCNAVTRRGIDWSNATLGEEISMPCPGNSIGWAKWACNMSGYWTPENPDMSDCRSRSVLDIKEKYFSLPANDIIDELEKILKNGSDVYGNDLMDIVSITASLPDKLYKETASLSDKERWSITADSVTHTTSIIDNIVGLTGTWDDLSQEETVDTGSNILKMIDDFGILLGDALFEADVHNIVAKFIAVQVLRVPFGEKVKVPRGQESFENLGEYIALSEGYDSQLDANDGNLSLVFAKYTNMNHILLSSGTTKGKGKQNILNSAVVSAVVSQNRSAVSVTTEAEISVRNLVAEPNDTACVFWNLDRNDWDTYGCRLNFSNVTHSVCVCDHLTNFAVLMDFQGRIKDVGSLPFFYITVIGCSISIVCLALCIAVFICYSCYSQNVWGLRYTIHRNLCLTLCIANLLLLTGLNRTNNQMICSIIAGLLHYFFLSAFSWMLLEALHIYLLLVVVFASRRSHWEKYYIFGYGFPLLIVAITVAVRWDGYGTEKACWLSAENGVMWSFTGPAAGILTVNCCALILAQWKANRFSVNDDNIALIKRWLRVTVILFPILGITWLIGFFYVGKHYKVAAYLFALLNSLQGFCIFIFHCVLDTKARNLVLDSLRKKQTSITTESSGTPKKQKIGKKKRSIVPLADVNLTPVRSFKSDKCSPIKQKRNFWWKPWTFYFNLRVAQNSQYSDSHEDDKGSPKVIVLQWNIPHSISAM